MPKKFKCPLCKKFSSKTQHGLLSHIGKKHPDDLRDYKLEKGLVKPHGRPPAINDEVVNDLELALQTGMNIVDASVFAGVSDDVVYDKMKEDESFFYRIKRAQLFIRLAAGKILVDKIVEDKDLATAKWLLIHKYPREFTVRPRIAIQRNRFEINDEQLQRLIGG